MALTTTTNSSANQTTTQTPQSATASNFGAGQSSGGVQPGTAAALLNSQGGIKLTNTTLSTVNLSAVSTSTTASSGVAHNTTKHPVNAPMLVFAGLLIIAAAVLFYTAGHSVKNTA